MPLRHRHATNRRARARSSPSTARARRSSSAAGRPRSSRSRRPGHGVAAADRCAALARGPDPPCGSSPASTARSRPGRTPSRLRSRTSRELGAERPVVLLPLLNPQGYARNWRYLNVAIYSERSTGRASATLAPAAVRRRIPHGRAPTRASSPEAAAITAWILRQPGGLPGGHQPRPARGQPDPRGVRVFAGRARVRRGTCDHGGRRAAGNRVPIKLDGKTRFDEPVVARHRRAGHRQLDRRADERPPGRRRRQGAARAGRGTVLVLETPAAALPLAQRVAAQAALLQLLSKYLITTHRRHTDRADAADRPHPRPCSTRPSA